MVVKPSQLGSSKEQPPSPPLQLSSLAGYQNFGDYLRVKRKQFRLTQGEMGKRFSTLTEQTYGYLERERRAPLVEELVPIFKVLMSLQSDKRLPPIQVIEAQTFFRLAKERIERKGKKRQSVSKEQWDRIEQELIGLVDSRQRTIVHLVADVPTDIIVLESPDSRRRKALGDALKEDTSHLLERQEWVKSISSYPDRDPQIKVAVVQAGMGGGKSHALALLIQRLAEREDLFLIPYRFLYSETMTPNDHLDEFLATLHADLTMKATDETKQRPLTERIEQVLKAIRALDDKKVVILLDDAQIMFPKASEWSTSWHQFFETFIKEPHQATLYMMTRTWPGWDERKRDFLLEDNLPELSVKAGIVIWKRQGFDDVEDALLQKVCEHTGTNPQAIEMLAFQARRRGYSMTWGDNSSNSTDNPHTTSLKKLLEGETLFSGNLDEKSRRALLQVFSNRLSGATMRLVECLALAPLGIPFKIVFEQFEYGDESFEDLVKASFADLGMAAAGRAAVVPLVREATLQSLTKQRKEEIEQQVTAFYAYWLTKLQKFRDDAEKSALITEMVLRHLRSRQLLEAAELFVCYAWLCALFGHMPRIQRVFDEYDEDNRGKAEDAEQEIGKALLSYQIATNSGNEISVAEIDRIYQAIYDKVVEANIKLHPHTAANVLHNMVMKCLDTFLFREAEQMFDEPFVHHAGLDIPEVRASYLHSKSLIYARRWEYDKRNRNEDNAQKMLHTCIALLCESITQWQLCLKNPLPLQAHYYHFRLARALNDYAYRQRLSGNFVRAEEAIEECIRLKKASAALPRSLAVSLSEYSQTLAAQGKNRLAEQFNEEAVQLMKQTIEKSGNAAFNPELGMLLKERSDIYMQQARLTEALPLLQQAVGLIGERASRRSFREEAERQISEIESIFVTGRDYKLDKRWFARFYDLALYDDLAWLQHAGPFSDDEQTEWDSLYPQRTKEEISDRLDALIVQSRQREFARSQEERRAPHLWYPHLPLDEIQQRISGFEQLRKEIESQETNAIVRMLYLERIEEDITTLRQCEATASQDQETVWKCNLALYGKPTEHEMVIALQPFCTMLLDAKQHEQAEPIAQALLVQLQSWGISPQEMASTTPIVAKQELLGNRPQSREKQYSFSYKVVQRFFQDVFDKEYRTAEWRVDIAPARDDPYVDAPKRTVFLPPCSYSLDKIRELLAEEVGIHAYRAIVGQHSPLALLGLGLAQHLPTEEGLAKHRIQQLSMQIDGKRKDDPWMGTMRAGLASGVITPALSFLELSAFFEKAFLISFLRKDRSSAREKLQAEAREEAWIQTARAFRGVPNLQEPGCCYLKDRIYLQGYMDVMQFLETHNEEQLYIGKIGTRHVDALAELHILKPHYSHQNIALMSDLPSRLSQYKDR